MKLLVYPLMFDEIISRFKEKLRIMWKIRIAVTTDSLSITWLLTPALSCDCWLPLYHVTADTRSITWLLTPALSRDCWHPLYHVTADTRSITWLLTPALSRDCWHPLYHDCWLPLYHMTADSRSITRSLIWPFMSHISCLSSTKLIELIERRQTKRTQLKVYTHRTNTRA